ncbi:MAG: hypothetical protein WAV51_05275 [Microgenomates group bacterium]
MKKKIVRRKQAAVRPVKKDEKKGFLFMLKSWMFVVMVALMLGIGAIIGNFLNTEMSADNPQVAGVSIEAE